MTVACGSEEERMGASDLVSSQGGLYAGKRDNYFAGVRTDYLSELPCDNGAWILDVGCGNGGTGAIALSKDKCKRYCGVEICSTAAEIARSKISEVVTGNIENVHLPWSTQSFDALILSEVLEHLVDPWAVLLKLRFLLKPGAKVFASSPNVSYHRIPSMLLRGEWRLADSGIMDITHLRWFTPRTYRSMFESCGYRVQYMQPRPPLSRKASIASRIVPRRYEHLFWYGIDLRATVP